MNLATKLKNRLPYPFETIAVAVTFSPRLSAVISEASRLAKLHKAKLLLIHVGTLSNKQFQKIQSIVESCNVKNQHYSIIASSGPIVSTILKICKENVVDLLVLGANKRESVFQHYVGTIARKISRKAKCSILLLPAPKERPKPFKKMVVSAVDNPKTPLTITTAIYLSNIENSIELFIVNEEYIPMFESAYADSATDEETEKRKSDYSNACKEKLSKIIDEIPGASSVNIRQRVIFGKPGHSIQVFAKSKQPDLLIVNSPSKRLGILDRLFPHDLEYLLENLPCNLLIVHSRGF